MAAKRAERDALTGRHRGPESAPGHDIDVTDIADVNALRRLLDTRELSAEDVIRAYINK